MNNLFMFNPFFPKLPVDYDIPPTIYAILNSYVNFDNPNPVKISNLANAGRGVIFDFDYPLTSNITKESFETMILNNFLMRRIGYETVTAFKIALNVKLNEIMPKYNKLFDSMKNWNLFTDGENIIRQQDTSSSSQENSTSTGSSNVSATASGTGSNISDRRFSNTPQNELSNVRDGKYVTEYNYDTDTSNTSNTSSSTESDSNTIAKNDSSTGAITETISRSNADKNDLFIKFSQEVNNVYTLIFRDLDPLFYGLL